MKDRSLNFDLLRTKIFADRTKTKFVKFMEWSAYALTGIFVGLTASCMTNIEHHLMHFRRDYTDKLIDNENGSLYSGWLLFSGISLICVTLAASMTIYFGPGAHGSGVSDIIAYLNGCNMPYVIGFETFLTKIFANVLGVAGGLCIGKEGPLAHIGANIGVITAYLPLPHYDHLRNDKSKRHLIAAGASAGIAAAFGSPVGGALFTYELSKPTTFWTFTVTWKVFMACATSVFTLAICQDLMKYGELKNVSASALRFVGSAELNNATIVTIPSCLINGALCGIIGAVFVKLNFKLSIYRKKFVTEKWMRVLEAIVISFISTSAFFWLPYFFKADCVNESTINAYSKDLMVTYNCPKGQYDPFATMFFNSEGDALRSILSGFEGQGGNQNDLMHLRIFICTWFVLTILTHGVWVPAGLFVPGIIIGSAVGATMELTY